MNDKKPAPDNKDTATDLAKTDKDKRNPSVSDTMASTETPAQRGGLTSDDAPRSNKR